MSVVIANIGRAIARLVVTLAATKPAEWLTPAPFSMESMRKMLGFGIPFSIGASAGFASRRFDNALVSSLFGAEVVGMYNLAYNVADVPAVQVGEQIGDVLLPSFAHMDEAQRKDALVRSTGLLGLVVFPLAVGLGAIAPTLVHALLRAEWADVGPMLSALSALSVVRPVGWTIMSYLQARDQPRAIMFLELLKLAAICVLILTLGRMGPIWACIGVGVAFTAHSIASMWVVRKLDGIPIWGLLGRSVPPLVACLPIVAGVLGIRYVLHHAGIESRFGNLIVEIVVGAVVYVGSALLFARRASADFINLLRNAIKRRRGKA
jgi:lipopolysaccharide exporter